MSTIKATTNEYVAKIEKFLGLHENPDGDTKLKLGEASQCKNWKITRDMNLQRRPGTKTMYNLDTGSPVQGMWFGNVKGKETGIAVSGGHLWLFYSEDYLPKVEDLGLIEAPNRVSFFAYSDIVYILTGVEYYSYDGTYFGPVVGYRPIIYKECPPEFSGANLAEQVNKLTGRQRAWYSPDGTSTVFQLPKIKGSYADLVSIDYVKDLATGEYIDPSQYTRDRYNGTVTFTAAPARGVDTIEIGYSAPSTYRTDVSTMTNAEIYLGAQDNAVFLYGNDTNKAIYSGIDESGQARADYFPDLNEMSVADANTPITGMIRHFSQLIVFKTDSTYVVHFGLITTATGDQEYGFYVTPVNKRIGNHALGQVRLVQNNPYTLHGNDLYVWSSNSRYSANLSSDERNAKQISERIYATLRTFSLKDCYCYDDNDNNEYYICYRDKALVCNYAADAWYFYTGVTINAMCNTADKVMFGTDDGRLCEISDAYTNDDGDPFYSYWESGSIDFGKNFMRHMMTQIWVSTKPMERSRVHVTVKTNKKGEYTEKEIFSTLSTFANMNFEAFSFLTARRPQVKKLKIKAKKFSFWKLVFWSDDKSSSATILTADPKVRETGYAK